MSTRAMILLAALALAGCGPLGEDGDSGAGAPSLVSPAPASAAARTFAPAGEGAARLTGALTVSVSQNLPDAAAAEGGAAPREVLKLAGATGYGLEAELVGAASPATLIEGQTVRALMGLPVEAAGALIYRVGAETKAGGAGLCGAAETGHVLVWEPEDVGEPVFKLMGLLGGAPGENGVRVCPALDYRRN